ncbi:hypothetical protein G6F65_017403 [Rhizopus arrhizus]|nr:hypothetical protein G6F65_017403 [Rhizopus arrhizus]
MPQQPAVHRAERQTLLAPGLPDLRRIAQMAGRPQIQRPYPHGTAHAVQQPRVPVGRQLIQLVDVAGVLPHHGRHQRSARPRVPQDGGGALRCQRHRRDLLPRPLGLGDGGAADADRLFQDLVGGLRHHAGPGRLHVQRLIFQARHVAVGGHGGCPRAGRALINGQNHGGSQRAVVLELGRAGLGIGVDGGAGGVPLDHEADDAGDEGHDRQDQKGPFQAVVLAKDRKHQQAHRGAGGTQRPDDAVGAGAQFAAERQRRQALAVGPRAAGVEQDEKRRQRHRQPQRHLPVEGSRQRCRRC